MVTNLVQYFYPDLKREEVKKFGILGFAFFLTIGAYWLMRLLKDTLFFKVCFPANLGWIECQGRLFQPFAKSISPFVVLALVLVYSKLVDIFKKDTLFYVICTFYTILFSAFTLLLFFRQAYGDVFLGKTVLAAFGWTSYFVVESFGSLLAALFWSFTNSITSSESAKRGYPFIIACAQIGAIAGSSLLFFVHKIGMWQLFALATLFTTSIMPVIYYFMKVIPPSEREDDSKDAKTTSSKKGARGFTEGIRLLLTRPYLMGILLISTLYEVINQILEYLMKSQADVFPRFSTEIGFAQFQGTYGVATNTLSFLMALLGTSYLIKRYGLRFGLLFFPAAIITALTSLYLFYQFGSPSAGTMLLATFIAMIIAKGLGYAVNNPVKEMMYIPTSKDVKYKTKGFIDVFGSRMAKFGGAQVNNAFKHSFSSLMVYGVFFSLGISVFWILGALFVATKNEELVENNEIIE